MDDRDKDAPNITGMEKGAQSLADASRQQSGSPSEVRTSEQHEADVPNKHPEGLMEDSDVSDYYGEQDGSDEKDLDAASHEEVLQEHEWSQDEHDATELPESQDIGQLQDWDPREHEKLNEKLTAKEFECDTLSEKLAVKESECTQLKETVSTTEAARDRLEEELKTKNSECETLNERLTAKESECDRLNERLACEESARSKLGEQLQVNETDRVRLSEELHASDETRGEL
jgi:chromosome segregation ATPase